MNNLGLLTMIKLTKGLRLLYKLVSICFKGYQDIFLRSRKCLGGTFWLETLLLAVFKGTRQ